MRILLTGGSGMVGRNIQEHASAREHEILAPSSSQLDLREYSVLEKWIKVHAPDLVVHAAGKVGGIEANMREPVRFLLDNLDVGRNVVWAARNGGIKRLINLGSSCMYPANICGPLAEEQILRGALEPTNEGYALAKITVARLCEYIRREAPGFQFKTLIPCNIYGRHDNFDPSHSHMVPAIIRKLHLAKEANAETVGIWGDGTARREFMYAADLADCIWRSVEEFDSLPPLMNVGLGYDWTINEYYATAATVVGYRGGFYHDLSKPVGMKRKLVSVDRSGKWGWHAQISLTEGLTKTYEYFLEDSDL